MSANDPLAAQYLDDRGFCRWCGYQTSGESPAAHGDECAVHLIHDLRAKVAEQSDRLQELEAQWGVMARANEARVKELEAEIQKVADDLTAENEDAHAKLNAIKACAEKWDCQGL